MPFFVLKPILDIIFPPSELVSQSSTSKSSISLPHLLEPLISLHFSKAPNPFQNPNYPYTNRSTIAPKAGSKRKGKEPICDSPPYFDHFGYPTLEAFKRYSTRTITFGRIIKFDHLDFIGFN